jgi:hypothetical protein
MEKKQWRSKKKKRNHEKGAPKKEAEQDGESEVNT